MVSTHQQYLCPDYLSPLPSTLDSNKSPLALLAQTCNSIGLPPDNQTSVNGRVKCDSSGGNKSSSKEDNSKGTKTATTLADSTSDLCESNSKDPSSSSEKKNAETSRRSNVETQEEAGKSDAPSTAQESTSALTADVAKASTATSLVSSSNSAATTSSASAIASSKCGTCITPGYPPHLFTHYFPPSSTAGFPYGHGVPSLPLSCYPSLQTPSVPMPMVPRLCTDPFCKTCPPSLSAMNAALTGPSFSAGARPCPLGCIQCTSHAPDLASWLNSYSLFNNGFHGLTSPNVPSLANLHGSMAPNSAALMAAAAAAANPMTAHYAAAQNASAQNGPPICWWNSGDGYCLKRFANAEELLQHLRTHSHESTAKNSLISSSLSGQLSSMSGRLSPRSTSYLNSLNSFRYHPYNKLSPTVTNPSAMSAMPHIPFPTMNPATFSLQSSLYGQRLPGSLPHTL